MVNTSLRSIIFILFFVHLIPANANCEFCKRESCRCDILFKEIMCNLKHETQTPDNTQPAQRLASGDFAGAGSGSGGSYSFGSGSRGSVLFSGLGSGNSHLNSGFGSSLLLRGGSVIVQPSPPTQGSQHSGNRLFNLTPRKDSLCHATSAAQFSGAIQLCRDTIMFASRFTEMLQLMLNGTEQPTENNTDWLYSFSSAYAYSLNSSNSASVWIHLENKLWLFIIITPNSNLAVLEWNQGNGAAYSINSFQRRELALRFLIEKISSFNCVSSGYYKKSDDEVDQEDS